MSFGPRIKSRRLEVGLTLEDVGKAVGVTKATVMRWESEEIRNLRKDRLEPLAYALSTTVDYLLGFVDSPEPDDPILQLYERIKWASRNLRHANGFLSRTPILETLAKVVSEVEFYQMLHDFDFIINYNADNPEHTAQWEDILGYRDVFGRPDELAEKTRDPLEYHKLSLIMRLKKLCDDLRRHRLDERYGYDVEEYDLDEPQPNDNE